MKEVLEFLSHFRGLAPEQWVGLIAFTALLIAGLALYVALTVVRYAKRK